MITTSIDALDHLHDLSKTTGLTAETLSGLQLAAKQSGSDLDAIAASVNKLAVNMGKHSEAFAELGVGDRGSGEHLKRFTLGGSKKPPLLSTCPGLNLLLRKLRSWLFTLG